MLYNIQQRLEQKFIMVWKLKVMAFTTCDEKFNITYPLDIYNNLKAFRLPPDHQKGLKSYLNLPPYSDSLEGTRADAI